MDVDILLKKINQSKFTVSILVSLFLVSLIAMTLQPWESFRTVTPSQQAESESQDSFTPPGYEAPPGYEVGPTQTTNLFSTFARKICMNDYYQEFNKNPNDPLWTNSIPTTVSYTILSNRIKQLLFPPQTQANGLVVFNPTCPSPDRIKEVKVLLEAYVTLFDVELRSTYNFCRSYFNVPLNSTIDNKCSEQNYDPTYMQAIASSIAPLVKDVVVKLENPIPLYTQRIQSGHDYYQILGVLPTSKIDGIIEKFLNLFAQFHPVVQKSCPSENDAKERFNLLMEAFVNIAISTTRGIYDMTRNAFEKVPLLKNVKNCTWATDMDLANKIALRKRTVLVGKDKVSHFRKRIEKGFDYYQVLGILPGASTDQISRAFSEAYVFYLSEMSEDAVKRTCEKNADIKFRFKLVLEAGNVLHSETDRFLYNVVRLSFGTIPLLSTISSSCTFKSNVDTLNKIASTRPSLPSGVELQSEKVLDVNDFERRIIGGFDIYQVLGVDPNCEFNNCVSSIYDQLEPILSGICATSGDTTLRLNTFVESILILSDPNKRTLYNLVRDKFTTVPPLVSVGTNCTFPASSDPEKLDAIRNTKAQVILEIIIDDKEVTKTYNKLNNETPKGPLAQQFESPQDKFFGYTIPGLIAGGLLSLTSLPVFLPIGAAFAGVYMGMDLASEAVRYNKELVRKDLIEKRKQMLLTDGTQIGGSPSGTFGGSPSGTFGGSPSGTK